MATFTRQEIIEGLERLGQLAAARGTSIKLALVGGALMVLRYEARESTRDVDAIILAPREASTVRELAQVVADEYGWPDDWLNDGAKGFLIGLRFRCGRTLSAGHRGPQPGNGVIAGDEAVSVA